MSLRYKHIMSFRDICSWILLITLLMSSQSVRSEVCVWRNPERTMKKIFPQAADYKTEDRSIDNKDRESIEKRLGEPLASGERNDWTYYEITDKAGKTLGYIIADAEKGKYGVIEIVMGITTEGEVVQVYIQRSRERNKEFKSDGFLEQFVGATILDSLQIGVDITAEKSKATEQVCFGVRKMLNMFDVLATNNMNKKEK